MLNIYWICKHMQKALGTVLRLSIKVNRSGDCFKWTLTLHRPGPTLARVWMCTALLLDMHTLSWHPLHVGSAPFSSDVFTVFAFIYLCFGGRASHWAMGAGQPHNTQNLHKRDARSYGCPWGVELFSLGTERFQATQVWSDIFSRQ